MTSRAVRIGSENYTRGIRQHDRRGSVGGQRRSGATGRGGGVTGIVETGSRFDQVSQRPRIIDLSKSSSNGSSNDITSRGS